MAIENIEAERLRKTFLRICGDKVKENSLGDKESIYNKKPYFFIYSDCPSIKKTLSASWPNWSFPTINPKWISGSGKSTKILTDKSMSMSLRSCTSDVSSIRPDCSPETFSILFSFWCMIWAAEEELQSKILSSSFMWEIQTKSDSNITFPWSSDRNKKLKTGNRDRFTSNSIWSRWGKTIWHAEKLYKQRERQSLK